MRRLPYHLLIVLALGCASESVDESPTAEPPAVESDLSWLVEREVHEPQAFFEDGGSLLIAWRQESDTGSDIYVSRRAADGRFGEPVRVNDEPATVESFPHDEMRVAVAVGQGGRVGIAWADQRGQVRATVSSDRGTTFAPSTRLEQTEAAAYRGFPAIAFGPSGALHAVWIDSRYAEGFAEEPADLYYAKLVAGTVTESNVTADQEATVCGCCRTFLEATDDGTVRAVFRNGADGYRDIFTAVGTERQGLRMVARVGQPLWELEGCPMSGPVAIAERVLWPDGSTGKRILMEAGFGADPAAPLFSDAERGDWSPRLSPRRVATPDASDYVLLPGRPDSRLIVRDRDAGGWTLVAEQLPAWASSAALERDSLLLVGAVDGDLEYEQRTIGR